MRILAIDPGPEQSAWVLYDSETKRIGNHVIQENEWIVRLMRNPDWPSSVDRLVVEMVASYGKPVGAEVFETCVWIGRFLQAAPQYAQPTRLFRREVKLHLCNATNAKDSHVRQALIDKFGPGRQKAIGTKAKPGPCYGLKDDEWQALALAVTFAEKYPNGKEN